jgi:hypothetical protein
MISDAFDGLAKNKLFNTTLDGISNGILVSLFGASLFESRLLKLPEGFIKGFSGFADKGNRVFQALNSLKNICKLYPRKDYINAFGHAGDWLALAVSKSKDHYNDRGWMSLAWYVFAHSLNIMNSKESFQNMDEYKSHIKLGLSKIKENFFTSPKVFAERLFKHEHAMMGVLGAALAFTGGTSFRVLEKLFGANGRAVGTTLRSLGGMCQGFEGMKPGHILSGRIFFGLSGYAQSMGALVNILSDTIGKNHKAALDPLSFAFGSLGRILYRISNERGEAGMENKEISLKNLKDLIPAVIEGIKPKSPSLVLAQ